MGLSDQRRRWLDFIGLSAVSYRIGWIILIVSAVLHSVGCIVSGNTGFYSLAGYWMDGTDGKDGLDGTLVVQG